MEQKTALVTGASRGLGLEFVRQLLENRFRVIATTRDAGPSTELGRLCALHPSRCEMIALDVSQPPSLAELRAKIASLSKLDWVINNAGIMGPSSGLSAEASEYADVFATNVLGPLQITQICRTKLSESPAPVLASLSSLMGSIDDNSSGGYGPYRVSKTALNMLNKNFSIELPQVVCVALHPGWVRTRMGGEAAPLEAPESVRGMISVLERLTLKDTGRFLDYEGDELAW